MPELHVFHDQSVDQHGSSGLSLSVNIFLFIFNHNSHPYDNQFDFHSWAFLSKKNRYVDSFSLCANPADHVKGQCTFCCVVWLCVGRAAACDWARRSGRSSQPANVISNSLFVFKKRYSSLYSSLQLQDRLPAHSRKLIAPMSKRFKIQTIPGLLGGHFKFGAFSATQKHLNFTLMHTHADPPISRFKERFFFSIRQFRQAERAERRVVRPPRWPLRHPPSLSLSLNT